MADTGKMEIEINEDAANAFTDRNSRAAGALGMKTLKNLRSLNVLIIGCRGTGMETAKNLVLTGPNSVTMWDREPTRIVDLGANFYLKMEDVTGAVPRADAVQKETQGLNPYCAVKSFDGTFEELCTTLLPRKEDPIGCVVVTELLPKANLFKLNEMCREQGATFLMALTTGVTATLFSDFGAEHTCTDPDGEPTETFAVKHLEVVKRHKLLEVTGTEEDEPIVVLSIAGAKHGLDDGDLIELEDLRGPLAVLNGKEGVKVKRVYYKTPDDKEVQAELEQSSMKGLITGSGLEKVVGLLQAKADNTDCDKFRTRQMLNRFVLDLSGTDAKIGMDSFEAWTQGGLVNQKKKPTTFKHGSLQETLVCPPGRLPSLPLVTPQHMSQASWENGHATDIHICWAAVLEFYEEYKRWPQLHNKDDVNNFYELAKKVNAGRAETANACVAAKWSWEAFAAERREVDELRAKRFARYFPAELTGLCAFLGGAVAQEVVKKFGKYTPITQWLHYDDQDLITDEADSNTGPLMGTKYDWQVAIMGKSFQAKLAEQKIFLVGCGALGCEYLKGLALMGVATGSRGQIWVTDMDTIEVSNLSRQFLFRQDMVGKPKSVCGADVVKGWNPSLNIQSLEMFVGPKTENFFDDKFWENLDLCWNALDNVKARKYTDSRCLFFSKPLLESGTLGTKCNGEIILPFRTKSYNDGAESDDNENQIAMCTLKNFPFMKLHCIEYARQAIFDDYMTDEPTKYENFRKDLDGFLETIGAESLSSRVRVLKSVKRLVDAQGMGVTFQACVQIAFEKMMEDFRNSILDLIYSNPEDKKKEDGTPFWSGTKRFPTALDFSMKNDMAMQYLYCASNLYAFMYGLQYVRDMGEFIKIVEEMGLKNPDYKPKFVETKEEEEEEEDEGMEVESQDEEALLKQLMEWATKLDRSALKPLTPHDFEKDDDANFHIDFLTIASNLRCFNYDIKLSTRLHVKLTAGRIIPALATTTAMVCGLTELEFCKLVLGHENQGITKFKNSNINLGTATFNVFEPDEAIQYAKGVPKNYSSWDKIEIDVGNLTCGQFLQYFQMTYPGCTFQFLVNPAADTKEGQSPVLFDKFQAQVGQEAITQGTDLPDSVFTRFPQARMAKQMIGRFKEGSNNRLRFEKVLSGVRQYVEEGKKLADLNLYELYCKLYGAPPAGRDGTPRNYLLLRVADATDDDGEVTLPNIKYVFQH